MGECRAPGVFTAGFDAVQNVLVGVQVSVKDKPHGELCENKTQLRRKREKVESHDQVLLQLFDTTQKEKAPVIQGRAKTHIEDAVEDRLEDNDVTVARSFGKLLLLLHMLLSVVDVLVVLLCHPAGGLLY